ncbi:5-dehydro-4-deoxy-D-glucuronate isomerase [Roseobacter sp. HKCCD7870]|uniref:5-dehydro-4-deoxy-D-glucuronate isomerase n=1 Tax=Roseobacter sp. HKCCD7870 TaxID=3120343 RepID=UPI0030ED1269
MIEVETRHAIHPDHAKGMDTGMLRASFLVEGLFESGKIKLCYTHYDRFTLGGAVPNGGSLRLDKIAQTRTASFMERREMGIVNIGNTGQVSADGQLWEMAQGDVLYLGMGAGGVTFSGAGRFYITSAPAHHRYPHRLLTPKDSNRVALGAAETANERVINQFIHPLVMESCQLVMGYTTLGQGSVWNTMPPHTHDRRMEAYLYWDMAPEARVLHLMGETQETRHLVVGNEAAVLSPPWSIHAGAGHGHYRFIWAMAGDNVDFTDMDFVDLEDLR